MIESFRRNRNPSWFADQLARDWYCNTTSALRDLRHVFEPKCTLRARAIALGAEHLPLTEFIATETSPYFAQRDGTPGEAEFSYQ